MKVQRLDHLVFAVQELEQAADTWARTLGLRAEPPYRPEGSHLELARLPLDDPDGHGAFLELAKPTVADHRLARHIEERGEGMFSMSVEVDDLDAAVRELRAKGVTVSDPEAGVWPGSRARPEQRRRVARIPRAFAHGVGVQLIERSQTS